MVPRQLTPQGKQALQQIADIISQSQAIRIKENLDINLSILNQEKNLLGIIYQWEGSRKDLLIIEWIFLAYQA